MSSALILDPGDEPSPEQVVQAVTGQLRVLRDGQRIGLALPPKLRPEFLAAIHHQYLLHAALNGRLHYAFLWWCEARRIPCVRFEIVGNLLEMGSSEDHWVRVHIDFETAGRILTKAGLLAVAGILFDYLSNVTLSPWHIKAEMLPLPIARRMVSRLLETTNEADMTADNEDDELTTDMVH